MNDEFAPSRKMTWDELLAERNKIADERGRLKIETDIRREDNMKLYKEIDRLKAELRDAVLTEKEYWLKAQSDLEQDRDLWKSLAQRMEIERNVMRSKAETLEIQHKIFKIDVKSEMAKLEAERDYERERCVSLQQIKNEMKSRDEKLAEALRKIREHGADSKGKLNWQAEFAKAALAEFEKGAL